MLLLVSLGMRLLKSFYTIVVNLLWGPENVAFWMDVTDNSGPVPSMRCALHTTILDNGLFISHGSQLDLAANAGLYLNDTWWFSFEHEQWYRVDINGAVPSSRSQGSIAMHGKSVYLHGGEAEPLSQQPLSDLWRFTSGSWHQIHSSTEQPTLQSHSFVVFDNLLLAFGGLTTEVGNGLRVVSELWQLDLTTYEWRRRDPLPLWPSARYAHTAVALDGTMVVFGGFASNVAPSRSMDDLWVYWPESNAWEQLNAEGGPAARGGHAAATDGDKRSMFILGGAPCRTGCQCHSDLWEYSLVEGRWSRIVLPRRAPPARFFHSLVISERTLYLFGGKSSEHHKHFNDVWKLDLGLLGKPVAPGDRAPVPGRPAPRPPSFRTAPPWPRLRPRANPHLAALRLLAAGALFVGGVPALLAWLRARRPRTPRPP
eukprot:EG_transcript_13765